MKVKMINRVPVPANGKEAYTPEIGEVVDVADSIAESLFRGNDAESAESVGVNVAIDGDVIESAVVDGVKDAIDDNVEEVIRPKKRRGRKTKMLDGAPENK